MSEAIDAVGCVLGKGVRPGRSKGEYGGAHSISIACLRAESGGCGWWCARAMGVCAGRGAGEEKGRIDVEETRAI